MLHCSDHSTWCTTADHSLLVPLCHHPLLCVADVVGIPAVLTSSLLSTQAVWFSATGDLAQDAKRDFRDIGALAFDIVRLHDLKHSKVKAGDKLADAKGFDCGVLFSTYDLLISGKKVSVKSGNGVVLQHGEVAEENECDGLLNGPPVDKSAEARAGKYEFRECAASCGPVTSPALMPGGKYTLVS